MAMMTQQDLQQLFGDTSARTPAATQALQDTNNAVGGTAPWQEDPQGQLAIPTNSAQMKAMGIPQTSAEIGAMRFSPHPVAARPAPGNADAYFRSLPDGPDVPLETRAMTGGDSALVGIGSLQLAQGIVSLGEMAGMYGPEARQSMQTRIDEAIKNLSPDRQASLQREWASLDANSVAQNPSAIYHQILMQIPNFAAMLVPEAAIGIKAGGAIRAGEAALKAAAPGTEAATAAEAALAATKARVASSAAPAVVGAATEGGITAGQNYSQTAGQIEQMLQAMPDAEVAKTPLGAALIAQGVDPANLRGAIVAQAATLPNVTAGALSAIFGAYAGKYFSKLFQGSQAVEGVIPKAAKGFRGRAGRIGEAAAVEGLAQEGPQSAIEQVGQNYAAQQVDPSISLTQGVLENTLQGIGTGGPMGGAVGAFSSAPHNTAIPTGEPPPAGTPPNAGLLPAPNPTLPPPPSNIAGLLPSPNSQIPATLPLASEGQTQPPAPPPGGGGGVTGTATALPVTGATIQASNEQEHLAKTLASNLQQAVQAQQASEEAVNRLQLLPDVYQQHPAFTQELTAAKQQVEAARQAVTAARTAYELNRNRTQPAPVAPSTAIPVAGTAVAAPATQTPVAKPAATAPQAPAAPKEVIQQPAAPATSATQGAPSGQSQTEAQTQTLLKSSTPATQGKPTNGQQKTNAANASNARNAGNGQVVAEEVPAQAGQENAQGQVAPSSTREEVVSALTHSAQQVAGLESRSTTKKGAKLSGVSTRARFEALGHMVVAQEKAADHFSGEKAPAKPALSREERARINAERAANKDQAVIDALQPASKLEEAQYKRLSTKLRYVEDNAGKLDEAGLRKAFSNEDAAALAKILKARHERLMAALNAKTDTAAPKKTLADQLMAKAQDRNPTLAAAKLFVQKLLPNEKGDARAVVKAKLPNLENSRVHAIIAAVKKEGKHGILGERANKIIDLFSRAALGETHAVRDLRAFLENPFGIAANRITEADRFTNDTIDALISEAEKVGANVRGEAVAPKEAKEKAGPDRLHTPVQLSNEAVPGAEEAGIAVHTVQDAEQLATETGNPEGTKLFEGLRAHFATLLDSGHFMSEVRALVGYVKAMVHGGELNEIPHESAKKLIDVWMNDRELHLAGALPSEGALAYYERHAEELVQGFVDFVKNNKINGAQRILDSHERFFRTFIEPKLKPGTSAMDNPVQAMENEVKTAETTKAVARRLGRKKGADAGVVTSPTRKPGRQAPGSKVTNAPAFNIESQIARLAQGESIMDYFDNALVHGGAVHDAQDFVRGLLPLLQEGSVYSKLLNNMLKKGVFRNAQVILGQQHDRRGHVTVYKQTSNGSIGPGNDIFINASGFHTGEDMSHAAIGSSMARTFAHEAVHLASNSALVTDKVFRAQIEKLMAVAKKRAVDKNAYGLENAYEFVAEGLTNTKFRDFLQGEVMNRFMEAIRSMLRRLGFNIQSKSLYDLLKTAYDENTYSGEERTSAFDHIREGLMKMKRDAYIQTGKVPSTATDGIDWLFKTGLLNDPLDTTNFNPLAQDLGETGALFNQALDRGASFASTISKWAIRGNLGFMDYDTMKRTYRDLMAKAAKNFGLKNNPLEDFVRAVNHAGPMGRDLITKGQDIIDGIEKLNGDQQHALYTVMRDATMSKMHVDHPITDAINSHLQTSAEKTKALAAQALYEALPKGSKEIYAQARDLLKEAYEKRRDGMMNYAAQNALFTDAQRNEFMKIRTLDQWTAFEAKWNDKPNAIGNDLTLGESLASAAAKIIDANEVRGPYFPLTRQGEEVLIYPDYADGKPLVSHYKNIYEAEKDAKAKGFQPGSYRIVTKRAEDVLPGELKQVFAAVANTVHDPDAKQMVINNMIEMLAEASIHGRSLKREFIPGVHAESMGKAFRDYIGASSYAIGDLATSHEIEVALKQLQDLGSQPLDHTNDPGHPDYISGAEQRMVGSIRKEISKRRQEQARDRNVGQMERALGTVGFLNFLGAPSYWLLNMTQNVTVGVPTLATTSGKTYTQAAAGLVSSMKVLMKAAGEGGLVSKGKNIYNIEEFIKGLPEKYGALIKHLIDENAIGSTIAQEFGNTLSDFALAKQPVVKTVMGVLQGAPQAVEYFNRMAMAMAAYDLTTGTEEAKRLAAQDAVERAHFNYSPANRARLLKTLPSFLGGGGEAVVRPIMMFKVYGVNMMRLVYGSAYDAVKGDTPETRAAARKMLFGLLASHTLVGGIYGGLGLGAVEIAGAAINAILGPDDKIDWGYEMDRWLSEVTNDYVARVVTRGLPAALGADMSQSANLGNLLFMLPGRADPAAPGGAEQIGFSLLGPMAEYGASTVRTASKYIEDGHGLGDLLSTVGKMAPLKMVRELTNTVEMAGGLETANGQSFMDASEVPITSLLMKGLLGLRPAIVTQRQDRFYSDRAYTVAMENRKSRLEAAALGAKSESDAQRAQDAIQEFNKVQYQKGNTTLVINPDDLQRAAKSRMSVSRRYAAGQYTQYNR